MSLALRGLALASAVGAAIKADRARLTVVEARGHRWAFSNVAASSPATYRVDDYWLRVTTGEIWRNEMSGGSQVWAYKGLISSSQFDAYSTILTQQSQSLADHTDRLNALETQPYALLRIGAVQAFPNAAWTTLTGWVLDEINGLTLQAPAGLLTVQRAGVYEVKYTASFLAGTTGIRGVRVAVNGVDSKNILANPMTQFQTAVSVIDELRLAAGDTVGFQGYQSSGTTANQLQGDGPGRFTTAKLRRVGP